METLLKFSEKFKEERNFNSCQEAKQCLSQIVSHLSSSSWNDTSVQDKLILYTCLRLLLRDSKLIEEFMINGLCICVLSEELTSATHRYLNNTSDSEIHLQTSLVMELTNIIQKLAHHTSGSLSSLLECGIQKQLLFLLSSYNNQILQCSLNGLINLSKNLDGRKAILDTYPLESLLHLINDNLMESVQASASDLILLLSQEIDMQRQIKEQDLFSSCLNLVQSNTHNVYVKTRLLESIERILDDEELIENFRDLGGIAVIMILLTPQNSTNDDETDNDFLLQNDNQRLLIACLSLLTSLSLNDICAKQIVDHNGLYLISCYLITTIHTAEKQVQLYSMRALRYLFSLERNRRFFKRLFPLFIFEDFINIGHYVHNLLPYTKLVDALLLLSPEDKLVLHTNQKSLNQTNCQLCTIGEYSVLELLGTGAYGSVYKVRKGTHGNLYALKEIQGNHPVLGSFRTAQDRKESIGRIKNEVAMINEKLRHPNIVRYYNCFEESHYLYIEMSLIDGAPLSEFITSMKEKQMHFTEERIWHIFSQMIRALRYLHEDKKIVHRDLKPANMILGEQDKLTITDFGLAKHHKDFSVMKSIVGTMVYWCPELVENKEYNKKADIWAAGCILYELASLQPPFYATNLLSLATKIAEGKYDSIPLDKYSPLMKDIISSCLTVDASERADTIKIGGMMSDYLMRQFDHVVYQLENVSTTNKTVVTYNSEGLEDRGQSTKRRLVFESNGSNNDSVVSLDASPLITRMSIIQDQLPTDSNGIYTEPVAVPFLRHRSYSLSPVPSYRQSRSGSALLKVSPQKLREIADPVGDLLQVVHKLNQTHKSEQASDPAYSIVSRYIRNLFSDTTSSFDAKELKNELWKLATSSSQHVTLLSPLPHLLPAALAEYPHIPSSSNTSVTYEQLYSFLEEVLKKTTYYKDK